MSKTLFYRWFGLGGIPKNAKAQIQSEGIVLQDEGISGSITFLKYRAPGRYHRWKRSWFSGSIALTKQHFLAFSGARTIIGVSWEHEKIHVLHALIEKQDTLRVDFDASIFDENASGDIELRFSTPLAAEFLKQINRLTV
ncbi:MAG: hypothetical protein AAF512_15575 [Pseudomonadota bacterium]